MNKGAALCWILVLSVAAGTAAADQRRVVVTTASELLKAIGPSTTIELRPGRYVISDELKAANPQVEWDSYEGCFVKELTDLELIGGEGVEVLSPSSTYAVLNFKGCSRVYLEGIRFGHTEQVEGCSGGVLGFTECRDVSVVHCVMFGCGVRGISITETKGVKVTDSVVEKCTTDIAYLSACEDVRFVKTTFRGNRSYGEPFSLYEAKKVRFDECTIVDTFIEGEGEGALFGLDEASDLTLVGGAARNNCVASVASRNDRVRLEGFTFEPGGCPAAPPVEPMVSQAPLPPFRTVTVRTTAELLTELRPNQEMILQAKDYVFDGTMGKKSAFARVDDDGDGLRISGVQKLRIRGVAGTRLISKSDTAAVVTLDDCLDCEFDTIVLGHEPPADACYGPVLTVRRSKDVRLKGCRLFGCGTEGIILDKASFILVSDCVIDGCTAGLVSVTGSKVRFVATRFVDNRGYAGVTLSDRSEMVLEGCQFLRNAVSNGDLLYADKFSHLVLSGGRIEANDVAGLRGGEGRIDVQSVEEVRNRYQESEGGEESYDDDDGD